MNQPHRALSTVLLAGLCASLPGLASVAGASADTPHVKAALLAPFSAVQPGETIRLGLQQRIIPHWHTYWLNPGDSGLPTRIEWSLPAGASAGPIEWPAPRRFATGPVSNYGYADQVTLLTPIQVPADLKPGSRFTVQASVDWLVCNEVCIPEQVVLSLELPVIVPGVPRQPGSPLIEQTRAALPRPSPLPVTLEKGARSLRLSTEGPALAALQPVEGWFYAAEWGKTHHGAPQALKRDGNRLSLEIQAGEAPPPRARTHGVPAPSRRGNPDTIAASAPRYGASLMAVLRVKNWASFQHYRDRSPPWIKLHKGLLDDFDYARLPLASKALAPCIWILASESAEGEVPADIDYLAFRLHCTAADVESAVKPLIAAGFLIDASNALAACKQVARTEVEGELEREVETESTLRVLGEIPSPPVPASEES